MEILIQSTRIEVCGGDITRSPLECIVNAANTSLLGGGGVDGAIHRAGGKAILDECVQIRNRQGNCPVGEAVITTGGRLKARHVIHTVGPVWNNGILGEVEKLRNCYIHSLDLAGANGIKTISFPNISTGIYRFPKRKAAEVALDTVKEYVQGTATFQHIQFVCFDEENLSIYESIMKEYTPV